jgi:hypothetical protein
LRKGVKGKEKIEKKTGALVAESKGRIEKKKKKKEATWVAR